MRLLSIAGENFGVWNDAELRFDRGLQIVYGPNEAGKTTLLRLIRETLFGFPKTGHELAWGTRAVAGQGRLELGDGRTLRFRRQKGRPDLVEGELEGNRTRIDAEQLGSLLDGAYPELFQQLFAFTLRELMEGDASLKQAGVSETLFASGYGGLQHVRKIQQELAGERDKLFTPRGRTQTLPKLLQELQSLRTRQRELELAPQRLDETRAALAAARASVAECEEQLRGLRLRRTQLEARSKAAPLVRRYRQILAQLQEIELPPELTGTLLGDLKDLQQRRCELLADRQALEQRLEQASRAHLPPATPAELAVRELAPQIRRWAEQLSSQRQLESDLPRWERELTDLQARFGQLRDSLGIDWTEAEIRSRMIGKLQLQRLTELQQRQAELRESGTAVNTHLLTFDQRLQEIERQLGELSETADLTLWDSRLVQAEVWQEQQRQLQDLQRQVAQLSGQRERLLQQVVQRWQGAGGNWLNPVDRTTSSAAAPFTDWENVPLPVVAVAQQHRERLHEITEQVEADEKLACKLKSDLTQLQRELAELDRLHPQLNREELLALRRERNSLTEQLMTGLLEAGPESFSALQPVWIKAAQRLQELNFAVDQLADHQFAAAEQLARRDQLVARIERLENELADHDENLRMSQAARQQAEQDWTQIWQPAGLLPGPPSAVLEWFPLYDQLLRMTEELARLQQDVSACNADCQRSAAPLITLFPEATEPYSLIKRLQAERERTRQTQLDRERLLREREHVLARCIPLQDQQRQLRIAEGEFNSQVRSFLDELQFPAEWDLSIAASILTEIVELKQLLNRCDSVQMQITRGRELQEQLKAELLAAPVVTHTFRPTDSVTAVLSQLIDELERTETTERQRREQERTSAELDHQLRLILQRLDENEQRLEEKLRQSGISNAAELPDVIKLFEAASKCQGELREIDLQLLQLGFRFAELDESLAEGDWETDWKVQLEENQQAIEALQLQYRQAVEQETLNRQQLEIWTQTNPRAELVHRERSLLAEFSTGASRWATLTLAETLLQRVANRFEQQHQPLLLQEVSRWLKQLTEGRYPKLLAKPDRPGEIRVLDLQGNELTPAQLSTGTREQLFLAIRLAYVAQYAQQHEPLPMVLDDVLVNFDEARARAALQALLEFSRLNQIILLTCHRRTVELAQQVHPEIPLSELQVGRLTSPLPVLVESTSPVQPPVEQSRRKATRKRELKSKPLLTDLEEL